MYEITLPGVILLCNGGVDTNYITLSSVVRLAPIKSHPIHTHEGWMQFQSNNHSRVLSHSPQTLTSAQNAEYNHSQALWCFHYKNDIYVNLMRNGLGNASGSVSVSCNGGAIGRDTGKRSHRTESGET